MVDIIEKKSKISISLIEFFTLTYAKHLNIMYQRDNGDFFIVYLSYKNFLKGYGKEFTDPFRRKQNKKEMPFYITIHNKRIRTRIAQLHFFKWSFQNELISYIERNYEKINLKNNEYKQKKTKLKNNRANQYNMNNSVVF